MPPELENPPDVPSHLLHVWRCFWQASNARPLGGMGGAGGIPLSEIEAQLRLHRITDWDEQTSFVEYVQALDHEYLVYQNEVYEAKQRNASMKTASWPP